MGTTNQRVPGLVLTDHLFRVPLDHARPDGEQIETTTIVCRAALSEETAAAIAGCRVWVTNEFAHNGLRAEGGRGEE